MATPERNNKVNKCTRCSRATFVETEEGASADFRHGSENHREVFTTQQMVDHLRLKGYVVIDARKLVEAA